jgi:hypothetical protein
MLDLRPIGGFFRVDASRLGCLPDADGRHWDLRLEQDCGSQGKMDSLSDLRIVGRVCDWGFRRRLLQTRCRKLKVGEVVAFRCHGLLGQDFWGGP